MRGRHVLVLAVAISVAITSLAGQRPKGGYVWASDSNTDAQDEGPTPATESIRRFVSWNIERLGTRSPRRTQEQLNAIAQRILTFDAAVLILQEIDDVSVLRNIQTQLGRSWKICHLGTENALLYDEYRVEMLSVQLLNNLANPPYTVYPGRDSSRPISGVVRPVRMYAEPFRVIGIHCYYADADIRAAEGAWLSNKIIEFLQTPAEPPDIILAGDTNGNPGSPPHISLQQGGILYRLPKENGDVTVVDGRKVDHFYVTEAVKDELPKQSAFVIRPELYGQTPNEFRETYSDHYPILIDFKPNAHTDLIDYAHFAAHWCQSPCNLANKWCYGADLTGNGEVGLEDLRQFAASWLIDMP